MSLCRIDVQQLAPDRWVVELEAGAYARRKRVVLRGLHSFGETVAAIDKADGELTTPPVKKAEELAIEAGPVAVFAGPDTLMGLDETGQAHELAEPLLPEPVSRETFESGMQFEPKAPKLAPGAEFRNRTAYERATDEQIAEGQALGLHVDRRWARARVDKLLEARRRRQETAAE